MNLTKYFEKLKFSVENNKKTDNLPQDKISDSEAIKILESENLSKLKHIIDQPKEKTPDHRFEKIKQLLNTKTNNLIIQEERWQPAIYCPNCYSTDIHLLTEDEQISNHHFKYLCLVCRSRFNDDTKTPFEFSVPPLDVWIQCWFLLGCSDSLEYIAAKLHIDISIIKQMIHDMQELFQVKQPLTRTLSYADWANQYGKVYSQKIKEEILTKKRKTKELQQGISVNQPVDTAEIRRQESKKPSSPKNKKV